MPASAFESLRPDPPRGRYKAVLFDFDGTLSLLREGWPQVMVGMMVEALLPTNPTETEAELAILVEEFVMALNGRPAIFQMARLVEEIRSRGGTPNLPTDYLREYDRRLLKVVGERYREIQEGHVPPARWAVPGAHALLAALRLRGLPLYLASGTQLKHVRFENNLLEFTPYFGPEINAPDGDDSTFSKRAVIDRILVENGIHGEELLSFGDGVVETQEVRKVGGTAVAVASDLETGAINQAKRTLLAAAGADVVIADYQRQEELLGWLFGDNAQSVIGSVPLSPEAGERGKTWPSSQHKGPEMPFPQFDRSRLRLQPLARRQHDLTLNDLLPLDAPAEFTHPALSVLAERLAAARKAGAARMLVMGAHVLRAGVQRHLIDLMERGLVDHIALNGAGPIHDWEFALIGATTESVARYVRSGEFGLWEETGRLNDVIAAGVSHGMGIGEAIGKAIAEGPFPHKETSVLAAAYRLRVPVTVHIGIGYDIIHEHPNCDGGALGRASYTDFLIFAQTCTRLEGGVMLNFGSAVMGPEVYLKALTMARNVAHQDGKQIAHFTTAVFDLIPLDGDTRVQAPKTDPRYYYRPWKTILVRTVADGGESYYVAGDHRQTVPGLRREAVRLW